MVPVLYSIPIYDPNPLDGACVKNIIQSAKRTKGNPIVRKEPTSTEIIKKIIDKFAAEGASLKDLRIATMCTCPSIYAVVKICHIQIPPVL